MELGDKSTKFKFLFVCVKWTMCVQRPQRSEEVGCPGAIVTDDCRLTDVGLESKPSPLQDQQVFLTTQL